MIFLAPLIGYLIGSIPFGLVLTRFAGMGDVRTIGSGNIGATNVLRTGNKFLAFLTLICDSGKGAAAAFIACLTNDNETRTHDGVCTGGTCTDGLIGDTCSVDADCDLWRCDFS